MATDNEIKIVINADNKAANVITGLTKSLNGVVSAVSDITNEYVEYGDQVKQLSSFTGMQADETSRLIQLADDAFVEFDTLKTAARTLAQDGVSPNIDTMARLSDQFLRLGSDAERSQFLLDNFGRAGIDMARVMELGGAKIKEMGANVESGLIIDQKKLEAITKNKQALDAFNDSMAAMKYEMAGKLLDVFTQLPKPLQDATLALGQFVNAGMLDGLANMLIIVTNLGKLGPALEGVGVAMKGIAVGTWAAVGPFLAVAAAIIAVGYAVYKLVEFCRMLNDMFAKARAGGFLDEFIKALSFGNIMNAIAGRAGGGPVEMGVPYTVGEHGRETFIPAVPGTIIPNGGRLGGGSVTLVYSPMFSLGDRQELESRLGPMVRNIMRGV